MMTVNTNGLDVDIKKVFDQPNVLSLTLSNEGEKTELEFITDKMGLEHTAEQIISALFDYDEDMTHRLYQEFGNVADLKEEIRELREEVESLGYEIENSNEY